jgi:hypothetical protein
MSSILMMKLLIIVIRILPVDVEICKVFEPHLGIDFGNFKVRKIARIDLIRALKT